MGLSKFIHIYVSYSVAAGLMVDPWSSVGMATSAGVITSLILLFVPHTKSLMVRLAFAGSYLGSMVWVLKTVVSIYRGRDVARRW